MSARWCKNKGNPIRGRQLYLNNKAVGCITCHRLEGVGGNVGPDLTRVWDTLSLEKVMESMLDPSKEIKEGYQTHVATTKTGLTVSGLKVSQNAKELILQRRDRQGGAHRCRRSRRGRRVEEIADARRRRAAPQLQRVHRSRRVPARSQVAGRTARHGADGVGGRAARVRSDEGVTRSRRIPIPTVAVISGKAAAAAGARSRPTWRARASTCVR